MPPSQVGRWTKGATARTNFVLCGALVSLTFTFTVLAYAQDPARIRQGMEIWQRAGCASCHGSDARGGESGEQPGGPNLRRSRLDREDFVATVACGRPGTAMPFNLAGAYTEISCYEIPVGEVPDEVVGGVRLTSDEIGLLVDYVMSLR